MIKILVTTVITLLLTSCHDSKMDKRVGTYLCKDHGGLYEIKPLALGDLRIKCNDNTRHSPSGVIVPVEELVL